MNSASLWSRGLIAVGSIAMLIGAIDPLEGSLVILPGSGLIALGTFLSQNERSFFTYRLLVFSLITIGVTALWGFTSVGGIGGSSGHTLWWGLLTLPYLIGWSMGIWGPGSPRWLLVLGIAIGLWYQVILATILTRAGLQRGGIAIIIGALGLVTIIGCIIRLGKETSVRR